MQFERFNRLYGEKSSEILSKKSVIVFGVGGVGSFVCEALIRSGIGNLTIVDPDFVDITNLNRQIQATHDTLGKKKVFAMKDRLKTINPNAKICAFDIFVDQTNIDSFKIEEYDYCVDAIDSVSSKIKIIETAKKKGTEVIAAMGCGNKKDPTRFRVSDIEKTSYCPLAKIVRKKLKDLGIKKVKVVWSDESPDAAIKSPDGSPSSSAFVPSVCGLIIASEIVKDLLGDGKI